MYLFSAILILLAGPFLYWLMATRKRLLIVLDGFIFVVIGWLVLFEVLPDAMHQGGAWVLLFAALGLLGPSLIERGFHRVARQMHIATLVLAFVGLLLHTLADGVALLPSESSNASLPLAVILHRVPVAIAVWWLLRPAFGSAAAMAGLLLMALGTSAGWWLGQHSLALESATGWAWFQGLVAGSVLHVVFNRPHLDHHSTETEVEKRGLGWIEGIGNLIGIVVIVAIGMLATGEVGHAHGEDLDGDVLETFLQLALASAPALLLAYLVGGLLAEYMPDSSIAWMRRGGSPSQALRGVAVGLPLPICSCGVVPLYRSLIQRGAPPAAAMAFLIATPELGIDALLLSIPLLGLDMTLARVIAAFAVALLVGWLIGRWAEAQSTVSSIAAPVDDAEADCCSHEHSGPEPVTEPSPSRFGRALAEGFGELVDNTAPWIVVGLVIAAIAQPLLAASGLDTAPAYVQVLLFAAIGMPVYVCATGATPIAAALLIGGISPGAVIAFLLTGPATNLTTFGVLSGLHGRHVAALFGLATGVFAIGCGLLTNIWLADFVPVADLLQGHEHESAPLWQIAALIALALLYLFSLLRRGARTFFGELLIQNETHSH